MNPPIEHLKRKAKRLKKRYPHVSLMQLQHDLAVYLCFKNWGALIKASPELIQKRIDDYPIDRL